MITLSDAALKMLARASKLRSISVFFDEGRVVARTLVDVDFLEPLGYGEYAITGRGRSYLVGLPVPVSVDPPPAPPAKPSKDTPRRRSRAEGERPVAGQPVRFAHLRARQKRILRYIDAHVREKNYPPTVREIGLAAGINSTSVVNYNLDQLVAWGWLAKTDGVSRGLCLIREMPGSRTKSETRLANGVLTIRVQLTGRPEAIVEAAANAIARLQEVIASAKEGAS